MATMDPGGKQIKTADEFAAHVMEVKDKLVVVDFFAAWCTPCQRIIPGLQELQTQFPNVVCHIVLTETFVALVLALAYIVLVRQYPFSMYGNGLTDAVG